MSEPAAPPPGSRPAPVLRPMRWWDVEQVVALERELFGETAWSPEAFWSELGSPGRWYVVADDGRGGPALGYAGLLTAGGEDADVQTVAVAPAAQGQGLGGALVDALVERARAAGAAAVLLEVRADNGPAQRLYAARGFTRIGVRRRYYQPGDVDALVMRLRLAGPGPQGHGPTLER